LQNASLDFDPVTLAPTYHLTLGIPGGSNALAIASQLGLPADIITEAQERLSKGAQEIEVLLADLMVEKQKLEAMQEEVRREKTEAERIRDQLLEERRHIKEQEQETLREIRERLVREGDDLQTQIRDAMYELKKSRSQEKLEQARRALAAVRDTLKSSAWQPEVVPTESKTGTGLAAGDRVWLKGINLQGYVISTIDSNGQLEIQVGNTRVKLFPENLEKVPAKEKESDYAHVKSSIPRRTASLELDLRGKRADEVEFELEVYLNDASLANLPQVRIIHGYGTGTVRHIVRQFLASHPLVSSFRSGKREEGGDGVTIVKL